jgi:hypothetical protein
LDHGTVTVQPAGPAGKRHVFLTLAFDTEETIGRNVEFVLSERAANRLAEGLISGSLGLMRQFNLSDDST